MPLLNLTTKSPDVDIDQALQEVINVATADWGGLGYQGTYPTTGFGISILRPKDLAVGDGTTLTGTAQSSIFWGFSFAAASTWYDIVSVTVDEDSYVLVTGVFDLMTVPLVTNLQPKIDGVDYPIFNIEELFAEEEARSWFVKPLPYGKPKTSFKVSAVAKAVHSLYWFGFMGYTIAKKVYLIST